MNGPAMPRHLAVCARVWQHKHMNKVGLFVFCLFMLCASSVGAESLSMRVHQHDGFTRVVFDLDRPLSYTLTKQDETSYSLTFEQGVDLGSLDVSTLKVTGIQSIAQTSESGAPLTLAIRLDDDARMRDFQVRDRAVLDIFDSNIEAPQAPNEKMSGEKTADVTPPPPAVKPEAAPEPTPEEEVIEDVVEETPETPETQEVLEEPEASEAQPEETPAEEPQDITEDTAEDVSEEAASADEMVTDEVAIEDAPAEEEIAVEPLPAEMEEPAIEELPLEEAVEEEAVQEDEVSVETVSDPEPDPNADDIPDLSQPASDRSVREIIAANTEAPEKTLTKAAVIALTVTKPIAMAAFQAGDKIWIVVDDPELSVLPGVMGDGELMNFESIEVPGGLAFYADLPAGVNHIYSEGGRFAWRIILSPDEFGKDQVNTGVMPQRIQYRPEDKPILSLASLQGKKETAEDEHAEEHAEEHGDSHAQDTHQEESHDEAADEEHAQDNHAQAASDAAPAVHIPDPVRSLFWPMDKVTKLIKFKDPFSGYTLHVATVLEADAYTRAFDFVGQDVMPSAAGLAVRAKFNDIESKIDLIENQRGVVFFSPKGLVYSDAQDIVSQAFSQSLASERNRAGRELNADETRKVFHFASWHMGGKKSLRQNENLLYASLSSKNASDMVPDLIALAKLNLANGNAAEASGFLRYALINQPLIRDSVEFRALRGASQVLLGQADLADESLKRLSITKYPELAYWKAANYATQHRWEAAYETLAKDEDFEILKTYPGEVRDYLALTLAEVYLNAREISKARNALKLYNHENPEANAWHQNTYAYLQGKAFNMLGDKDTAMTFWAPLEKGYDDLYRTKVGLTLVREALEADDVDMRQAIDTLEQLRYLWRGDELEIEIHHELGKVYIAAAQPTKGLSILRDTASNTSDKDEHRAIIQDMHEAFERAFMDEEYLSSLSALESITLYEEFKELTPEGQAGNAVVKGLVERMVDADLLDRAASLLEAQINTKMEGAEAANSQLRLAAINLMNESPEPALAAVAAAEDIYATLPDDTYTAQQWNDKIKAGVLLRARAQSQQGKTNEALDTLDQLQQSDEVLALKVDIAWEAGQWEDAGRILQDLMLERDITPDRALSEDEADLVLNRAVALNLAGDRIGLRALNRRYGEVMAATPRAAQFELVARERSEDSLINIDSLGALMNEVDLFGNFLKSYKGEDNPSPLGEGGRDNVADG